ncbi:ATP-binding cassette domain-containing protein [Candidatus Marinimicrobia bacterium]|nr:ATP-binding cassette domain-containing protein [Candidatus Neomarinimicrobiota bacterium]
MKNNDLIILNNIIKNFGNSTALNDLSFSIPKNSIFGLLGPNGSGKSTLMRILSGLIVEWNGEILFENQDIKLNQEHFLKKVWILD